MEILEQGYSMEEFRVKFSKLYKPSQEVILRPFERRKLDSNTFQVRNVQMYPCNYNTNVL